MWKRVTLLSASFYILNLCVLLVLRLFLLKYCFFNRFGIVARKLCIYWTKYTDNGLFTFVWFRFRPPKRKLWNNLAWLILLYVLVFGCIVNYCIQHQQAYILSQYPTIKLRLMRKGEDKDGKCRESKYSYFNVWMNNDITSSVCYVCRHVTNKLITG